MEATAGTPILRSRSNAQGGRLPAVRLIALTFSVLLIFQGCRSGKSDTPVSLATVESDLRAAKPNSDAYWDLCTTKTSLLTTLGRKDDALAWLGSLDAKSAPPKARIRVEMAWATLLLDLGQFREADRHLEQAIGAADVAGNPAARAALEVRRSRALLNLGELERAEEVLDQAEAFARTDKKSSLAPYIRHNRGLILSRTNRFEEALGPLTQTAAEFKAADRRGEAGNVLVSLGTCYFRLGRFDKAREIYQEALGMVPQEDRHLCVGHLGDVFFEERHYEKAAGHFREAALLAEPSDRNYHGLWLTNLATSLAELKQWGEAEQVNRRALDIERKLDNSLGLDHSRVNEARIEAGKGNYGTAERLLSALLNTSNLDLGARLDASSLLADVYVHGGRTGPAERQFESALALADASRAKLTEDENKLSLLASLIKLHQQYVQFLMDRNRAPEALAVAESSRARLLRERLNLPRRATVTSSAAEYQAVARSTGATLLAYWVAPGGSWRWTITGSGITASRLLDEAELQKLVERYQASVETPRRKKDGEAGRKLFEALGPPPAAANSRYIIVPDGPLYALNFETLPASGRFWIEDATIAVTPSLNLLASRHLAPRPGRSLLIIGDAVEWDENYEKLVNARKEIDAVTRQLPGGTRTILTEGAATPEAFLESHPANYSYIHFAAHATASRNAPMESAIILSRGSGKGRLSMQDVLKTPVNANLVTISACRSAGARTYAGEGLVGLAWAFVQSGARQVVAGLWKVNDYASPKLMEQMYAGIAAGKPPAAALRAAKLGLIRQGKFADPYYWGSLQLFLGALP